LLPFFVPAEQRSVASSDARSGGQGTVKNAAIFVEDPASIRGTIKQSRRDRNHQGLQ
jgi:hypothetical protein